MIPFFRKIRKKMTDDDKPLKYFRYAIGEIILVVIGILIALQVNNWNESRIEEKRVKEYAKSLIEDFENDIKMLKVSLSQAKQSYEAIDSLKQYTSVTKVTELSNSDLFILSTDMLYRPFKWNRSTFEELKSSGSLRYIDNDSLSKKLVTYESFSKHLDEDFSFDKANYEKAFVLISKIINLNSPYFKKMNLDDKEKMPLKSLFSTKEYQDSKSNDLKLISYDNALIREFTNTFILIQDNYEDRAFFEMPRIMKDAQEIITILKNEYQL